MKKLLIILFFACSAVFAQELPPANNQLVVDYLNNHRGQKVGTGICFDLLIGVGDYVDSVNGYRDSIMEDVSVTELQAGDIIDFKNVVFDDGRKAESHTAFVYNITSSGIISIAQQNVGSLKGADKIIYRGEKVSVVKDSKVEISVFDLSSVVSGKVSFFRL